MTEVKNDRKIWWIIILVALASLVYFFASAVFRNVNRSGGFYKNLMDDLVLDRRNHYLSCEELPTVEVVEQTFKDHSEMVQEIQEMVSLIFQQRLLNLKY